MRTVTTREAAALAGVSPATIRSWVAKGWLAPLPVLDPSRRHHLFKPDEVVRCEHDHRSRVRRAQFRRAKTQFEQVLDKASRLGNADA